MGASVRCPVCSGSLGVENDDYRGEWERVTYYCSACDEVYSRLITYKTQSTMVASDEWENIAVGPYHVVMYHEDSTGKYPIIAILETKDLDEDTVKGVIADYLIEDHDFDIEDVVEGSGRITYFQIDSSAVEQLQEIEWPKYLVPEVPEGEPPTVMLVQVKLVTYFAFKIGNED